MRLPSPSKEDGQPGAVSGKQPKQQLEEEEGGRTEDVDDQEDARLPTPSKDDTNVHLIGLLPLRMEEERSEGEQREGGTGWTEMLRVERAGGREVEGCRQRWPKQDIDPLSWNDRV